MLFPLATTGAMEPFPYLAGAAGALVGGLQNVGSGVAAWLSAHLPPNWTIQFGDVDVCYVYPYFIMLVAAGI